MKNSGLTFIKIIIGIFAVFAVVVVCYQLYKYNFVSIKTESAVMGEMEETVKGTGIFFREEQAIGNSGYTYLDVIRSEGERISTGGTIARVYADEQSAKLQKEIRQIEEKIKTYEDVLSNSGSYESASSGIDQAIYSDLQEISLEAKNGNAISAFSSAENLIINIMKHKIAAGDLVSYDTLLEELRGELSSLKASAGSSVKTMSTPRSGYFSLVTDGLEDQLTPEYLKDLTVDHFDEAVERCNSGSKNPDHVGKLVYDNSWSVAVKIPARFSERLETDQTVYIRIPSFGTDRIKCTVSDIRKSGEECILVLSSSVINDNILTLRMEDISLILQSYSGVQVRQSALRKVDGEDGVYVKVGLLLRYKKVHILYNDGVNAIIEYNALNSGGLRIYDQVVYKGSNLYDGKAVS